MLGEDGLLDVLVIFGYSTFRFVGYYIDMYVWHYHITMDVGQKYYT